MVLIATGPIKREQGGPAPAKLRCKAVEKCGGEVTTYKAPTRGPVREVDGRAGARRSGCRCRSEAAQALVDRVGQDEKRRLHERRLMRELEKLAIYAPEDARVDVETVEELTASDVEARPTSWPTR